MSNLEKVVEGIKKKMAREENLSAVLEEEKDQDFIDECVRDFIEQLKKKFENR